MRQLAEQASLAVSQSEIPPYNVLIDTDIGDDIDDALALAVALNSPEIAIRAITTVSGNTLLRAQLAAQLLHVFGSDHIPVAAGIANPLQFRHRPRGVPQSLVIDSNETFNNISQLSGPDLIIQTTLAYPGNLTLACIGQLTNIAVALTIEPKMCQAIRRIVMMGGSSSIPLTEWNVRSDTKAAQIVLASGIPVTLLGLNITARCQMRTENVSQLQNNQTEQTQLLTHLLRIWQAHRPRWQPNLPYLHDPLTIAALCQPDLFSFQEIPVRIITHGPFRGFMVPHWMNGPVVNAVTAIKVEQAREWVMQRLLASHRESS